MIDRIDLHIDVPRVNFEKLTATHRGKTCASGREPVETARAIPDLAEASKIQARQLTEALQQLAKSL